MSEWISVEDRLPPTTRPEVLFYIECMDQIELGKYNESTGLWMIPFRESEWQLKDVTHWMPLPEPPKEQDDD